jgi:hypothetical protein
MENLTTEQVINLEKRAREYIAMYGDEDPNIVNAGPPTPGQVVAMANEILQARAPKAPAKKPVAKKVTKKTIKKAVKKPAKKTAKK